MIKKGNFEVGLVCHTRSPAGLEALTFRWAYERMIHAEVMTHRWSRNYSSSRAIPYPRLVEWFAADPAMSLHLGTNRPGMQAGAEVADPDRFRRKVARRFYKTVDWCDRLIGGFRPHKEVINRFLEPWGWIVGVATMGRAQFLNFVALRCTPEANANIQRLAINALREYRASTPRSLEAGQWHVPFFHEYVPRGELADPGVLPALAWSAARCCWVSYANLDKDATYQDALRRHDDCVRLHHVTPLEHQLRARPDSLRHGVVPGYDSYRMMVPGESVSDLDVDAVLDRYGDRDYLVAD